MPFMETCRMEERIRMLTDYASGNWSVSELCRRYGVCRDTFYAWRERYQSGAEDWFVDRSHAPQHCPHRTAVGQAETIVALRRQFPHLGPRKLLAVLERRDPDRDWPAASTIGDLIKRAGLVEAVRRRRRALDQARPFARVAAANDEWAADFKGWFRTQDQRRIDPLTLSDAHTRYLLAVRIVAPTIAGAQGVFAGAFRSYGLPRAIRCDNGAPFGSHGAGGLTRLSAWWLKLGVAPHFIAPGAPQENGRHERMHRTLKQQTSQPAAANAVEQQLRFDAFRRHYNEERPHEALMQATPASLWRPPARTLAARLDDAWYDADHEVRRVRPTGEIKWRGELLFIGEALAGELVGLIEIDDGCHLVRFAGRDLGLIGRDRRFLRFAPPRARLRAAAKAAVTAEQ